MFAGMSKASGWSGQPRASALMIHTPQPFTTALNCRIRLAACVSHFLSHLANKLAAAMRLIDIIDGLEQADKILAAESLRIGIRLLCTSAAHHHRSIYAPASRYQGEAAGHNMQHECSTTAP